MSVVIETTIGDITVDLFIKERPKACLNFIKLCKLKYYNFNLFHRIEHGFIAQTGDPTGDGDKGDSVWGVIEGPQKKYFEAERMPKILHSEAGLLSMVSTGDDFIGSQFFFTLGTDLTSLDGTHCVIGEVAEGHEILRELNEAIVDDKHRPYKDIRVTHTIILEDPYADPRGFREPSRSPSPSAERLKNGRISADEDIDDTQGKTEAEVQEMLLEREAKARATILEIVGDIPDAEVAPPENVLFVCKLNPVTTDDDLQIIFSRFGKIKTCEVIRDKVSGDSLQYAFIEFEEQKSCEDAYFKMGNVLIDDRRIHVDFSQSVSKIKWRGKGNYTIHEDSDRFKSEKGFNKNRGNRQQGGFQRRSRSPRKEFDRNRQQMANDRPRFRNNDNRNDNRRFDDRRVDNRRFEDSRRMSPVTRRRSRSPKRRSPVQKRRSRSPRSRPSPKRRSRSPKRRSRSQRRRSPSPKRKSRSPKRRSPSPKKRSRSPKRRSKSPKRRSRSPQPRSSPRRRIPSRERSRDRNAKRRDPFPDRHEKSSKYPKKQKPQSGSSSKSPDSSHERKKKPIKSHEKRTRNRSNS